VNAGKAHRFRCNNIDGNSRKTSSGAKAPGSQENLCLGGNF